MLIVLKIKKYVSSQDIFLKWSKNRITYFKIYTLFKNFKYQSLNKFIIVKYSIVRVG